MDTLKAILLWVGWILAVIAIIAICVDWIMCKSALETATENYTRADKVREKVRAELVEQIEEYNKLTNGSIQVKTEDEGKDGDGSDKDDKGDGKGSDDKGDDKGDDGK